MPLFELVGTGMFSSNALWCMVLGVMPEKEGERENKMMDINRKDETKYKIEGIDKLTQLAESITKRIDFNDENLQDFTYAIRQLTRYVWGDDEATAALVELKEIYISYITEYFYLSVKSGKKDEATRNLELFGEEILQEDLYLREKLAKIATYKPLN